MATGRKTGGRQKGTPNKRTIERQKAMEEASESIADLLGIEATDAHTLLTAVYSNPDIPIGLRLDAAKAALPYEKPRLAAISMKQDPGEEFRHVHRIELVAVYPPKYDED